MKNLLPGLSSRGGNRGNATPLPQQQRFSAVRLLNDSSRQRLDSSIFATARPKLMQLICLVARNPLRHDEHARFRDIAPDSLKQTFLMLYQELIDRTAEQCCCWGRGFACAVCHSVRGLWLCHRCCCVLATQLPISHRLDRIGCLHGDTETILLLEMSSYAATVL